MLVSVCHFTGWCLVTAPQCILRAKPNRPTATREKKKKTFRSMFDFNCLICIRWIFYDKKETKYIFISRPRCVFCLCEWVPLSPSVSLSLSGQLFVFHQFGINSKLRTKSEFELNTNQSHLIFCSLVTRAQAHRFACRLTESCVAGDSVFLRLFQFSMANVVFKNVLRCWTFA